MAMTALSLRPRETAAVKRFCGLVRSYVVSAICERILAEASAHEGRMRDLARLDVDAANHSRIVAPFIVGEAHGERRDGRRQGLRRGARHAARHVGDAEV